MARISKRLKSLMKHEEQAKAEGYEIIAGVDEAGRGPLAGPVAAAACIVAPGRFFLKIDDSKKLTKEAREELYKEITEDPQIAFGIAVVDHLIIDALNIYQATVQAMMKAVDALSKKPNLLLVDGMSLPHSIPSRKLVNGDELSQSIMAAAILAKVTRDRIMEDYDQQFPQYGFKKHKGYGTKEHLDALNAYGPTPIHRKSFGPVKALITTSKA